MKRIIRTGVVVAMMLMGVSTFAMGSEPFVKVSAAGNKEFTLFINEVNAPAVVVSLKYVSGNTLYKEVLLSKDKYSKLFDLEILPVGTYSLQVEGDTSIKTWSVDLTSEGLSVNQDAKKEFFKPQLVIKNKVLGVSFFNKQNDNLTISLYNEQNEEIFSEKLSKDIVIMKQYDLSNMEKGMYTAVAKTAGRSFNQVITIK
ncbi:MAG: hypothetical protein AAF693_16410 [Bacteroidota bacterium]